MKYSVVTFGCRVNQADSLGFEEDLIAAGAEPVESDAADVVIVNTCSVTASSDQGARQTIRRIARVNPGAKIVVTGCYATRCPDEVRALPNVLHVVPNGRKDTVALATVGLASDRSPTGAAGRLSAAERSVSDLPAAVAGEGTATLSSAQRFGDGDGACGAAIQPGVAGRTAFTLRVQTGCAEPCSYCIIPATRGEPRSRPVRDLLSEIERVSAAGFKEIALTGVHLGSYGRDLSPRAALVDLLEVLSATIPGGPDAPLSLRISSLEPMDCTPEIVGLVAEHQCFAPHFHLPLQHASGTVLGRMRRPYTIEAYSRLVDDIRRRIPHAAIGSDVIVGFPGETDQDFEQLTSFLERSPLTHVHVFPYSDRPGTVASALGLKVHGGVIRERARQVREISNRLTRRFRASQVGTTHRALTLEDGSLAVTGNYLKLRIPAGKRRNEWVTVRVVDEGRGTLVN
jgi:threonylcarbamoyladenosine tRNA methylthiotransferase MtaB